MNKRRRRIARQRRKAKRLHVVEPTKALVEEKRLTDDVSAPARPVPS